jgi:hypothetical protein
MVLDDSTARGAVKFDATVSPAAATHGHYQEARCQTRAILFRMIRDFHV